MAAQPVQTMRTARRSSRPGGHTVSSSQAPPSRAKPANDTQRTMSKTALVVWLTVDVVPAAALSTPLPTTKRMVPATGCESAEMTRKLPV